MSLSTRLGISCSLIICSQVSTVHKFFIVVLVRIGELEAILELFCYCRQKHFSERFYQFLFVFQNFDLVILLKLEENLTFNFCTYEKINHSFACFYSDFCVFEDFLCFTEFLMLDYVLVFGCFNMVANEFTM